MSAEISPCGQYRYTLTREPIALWRTQPWWQPAVFCMLNPSTADAALDDPTIRRCRGFAERDGSMFNGIVVVNLYALRSKDPRALWGHADPVGPENDRWIEQVVRDAGTVVCAWGTNVQPWRVRRVVEILRGTGASLLCLGTTKDGHPRHPLYVRGDQPLVPWEPNA